MRCYAFGLYTKQTPCPPPASQIEHERDLRVREGHSLTVARWRRIASPQRKRPPETGWGRWGRGGCASPRVAAPPSPSRRLSCPRLSLAQAWFFPLVKSTPIFSLFPRLPDRVIRRSRGEKWAANRANIWARGLEFFTFWASYGPVFQTGGVQLPFFFC